MDDFELSMHRFNTDAYIDIKPTDLALIPTQKVRTAGGGYQVVEDAPRVTQTFRIIELGMQTTPPVLQLTDGSQREAGFWLLGRWDAVVDVGDRWSAPDTATGRVRQWEVGDVIRDNLYEVRAIVAERGK